MYHKEASIYMSLTKEGKLFVQAIIKYLVTCCSDAPIAGKQENGGL